MKELKILTGILFTCFCSGQAQAVDLDELLDTKAWQCSFSAEMDSHNEGNTGPGGMAQSSKRQFFQALGATGVKSESPEGKTDSYRETKKQSVRGEIRLHHIYDGGPDGIQIAGWNNGTAHVQAHHFFEGSEQKRTVFRDKTTSYNGSAKFEGEEYEPAFQIWVYPDQHVYALEYSLAPVRGQQVEHCRMKEEMEGGRKKLESANDAEMPLGSFFGGMTRVSCPSERKSQVDIDGGALSGMIENIPLPSELVFEGEGESQFVDSKGVKMHWSCRPE